MARTQLPNGVILPAEYSDDWYEDMTSNLTKLDDVIGSDSEKLNSNDVAFLRMSSAALTDGGTGNFSDLNSSNKLKTGDYVLDSGRKLYQIVSVNSTNETFTVGNSLFKVTAESDLAPVAESGDYDDLDNKPDLKPVATSGDYDDLTYLPTYGITRYCSSAITDNSSVAFSAISSTNKIKVGDFLLDTAGKMYQISSVDTSTETVSVTTPLTQLAVDSGVMHLSGNETASGIKSFSDDTFIKSLNFTNQVPSQSSSNSSILPIITTITYGDGSPSVQARFNLRVTADGSKSFYPHENNQYSLGLPSRKLKEIHAYSFKVNSDINGINPGALSLPDLSNGIDISGYISTGSSTNDSYTAPADGYLAIIMSSSSPCGMYVYDYSKGVFMRSNSITDSTYNNVCGVFIPVLKNQTMNIASKATENIVSAYFYPCQGNV